MKITYLYRKASIARLLSVYICQSCTSPSLAKNDKSSVFSGNSFRASDEYATPFTTGLGIFGVAGVDFFFAILSNNDSVDEAWLIEGESAGIGDVGGVGTCTWTGLTLATIGGIDGARILNELFAISIGGKRNCCGLFVVAFARGDSVVDGVGS